MTLTPLLRKFTLTTHVTFSVGWLGAVAGFLALAIAGLTSKDIQVVRSTLPFDETHRLACDRSGVFGGIAFRCCSSTWYAVGLIQVLLGSYKTPADRWSHSPFDCTHAASWLHCRYCSKKSNLEF